MEDKEIKNLTTVVDVVNIDTEPDKDSLAKVQATRFIDKIKSGKKPWEAAHEMHSSLKKITSSDEMKKALKDLIETAAMGEELRKMMVKSSLNKILMENYDSPEPKRQKLALEAAKLIAKDPEVGLDPREPAVSINFDSGLNERISDIDFEVKK